MSTPQNEVETDESSGVTTLRPVPVKPALLHELAESDSTSYFSATELLERGKALAVQSREPPPARTPATSPQEPEPEPQPQPEPSRQRAGWLAQFRSASLARKVAAILLPLLCALVLAKPMLLSSAHPAASKPSASVAALVAPPQPQLASPAPTASAATLVLPRGMTAAHAAADSVATGDFSRAAALYRELSRREPMNLAYREAARILGERTRARTP